MSAAIRNTPDARGCTDPVQAILDLLAAHGCTPRETGPGQWLSKCPAHDDRNPSLTVGTGDDGRALLTCHTGCEIEAIVAALGTTMAVLFPSDPSRNGRTRKSGGRRKIVATHDYRDGAGDLLYQVVRFQPKGFAQRRPDGNGGWIWDLKGVHRVLYRLPELLDTRTEVLVFICEGEKDCDQLFAIDVVATTCPQGACKWSKLSDDSVLEGHPIVILCDNDDQGHRHAHDVAQRLHGRAASVKIVELPDLAEHGDVSDFIAERRMDGKDDAAIRAELEAIVERTPLFDASSRHSPPNSLVERELLESTAPMDVAESFLRARYTDNDGQVLIRSYRREWWEYVGLGYRLRDDKEIDAIAYAYLHTCDAIRRRGENEIVEPYAPTRSRVGEVLAASAAQTIVVGDMPRWLDDHPKPDPKDAITFSDGILDARAWCEGRTELIPSTPAWFANASCPFAFDSNALCPTWIEFLKDALDDPESIALVQEWCGYQLVPDNQHERFMLMVGPPRSGKGTTLEGLSAMLGPDQVAVTSFTKISSRFGLAPLVGKLSAILPDAHIGRGTDAKAALEVIKSISGSDPQAIDRKHLHELPTVRLPVRFTIAVNELPQLPDEAGALQSRLLLLYFPKSFAGREDHTLKPRIAAEAPGIARWSLDGLRRLRTRRAFTIPARSRELTDTFNRLVSPVRGFVEDRCELDPETWSPKDDLYTAWKAWGDDQGVEAGTKSQFGQRLSNAFPGVSAARRGPRSAQFGVYTGIRLCSG